jgi:hypothetical protein
VPPNGGLAYEKPQSALRAFMRFFSGTFFYARETAMRFPLSGAKKRRIQPERYTQLRLNWLENIKNKTFKGKDELTKRIE